MAKLPLIGGDDADRLSELPEEIIHNILYRLDAPVQAARTSVLSRRWHHLWQSYPVLEFRHKEMGRSAAGHKKFAEFAAASSRRLSLHHDHSAGTPLDSLKLSLAKFPEPCSQYAREDFARLLSSALGASPLEVVVRTNWNYRFPAGLLSNCSRTKVMKLKGFDLNGLGSVSMQSLQVLTLKDVRISEQSLYAFLGNAPNLESLSLRLCHGIERLEVSASNFPRLKTLNIRGCGSQFELQLTTAPSLEGLVLSTSQRCKLRTMSLLSAPNLKSIQITSFCSEEIGRLDLDDFTNKLPSLQVLTVFPLSLGSDGQTEFQLTSAPCLKTLRFFCINWTSKLIIKSPGAAPNLKVLKLGMRMGFTQGDLDDLISNLPSLESLRLSRSRKSDMTKMRIRSDRLRAFELDEYEYEGEMEPLEELEIDAPGLLHASYSGISFRFPGKTNIVNVSSNCRFLVYGYSVSPTEMCFTHKWFLGLRQSLSTLTPFHLDMKLYVIYLSQQQEVLFDLGQVGCSSPPLIIQRLELGIPLLESTDIIPNDNPPAAIQPLETSSSELSSVRNYVNFLDGLFWACRPKIISMRQYSDAGRRSIEFMYEQLCNKDVVNCCVGAKCWRHELRGVKINDANMKIFDNDVIFPANGVEVTFTLRWC